MGIVSRLQHIKNRIVESFFSLSNTPAAYTGRVIGNVKRWTSSYSTPTYDWSRPDYTYWREAAWARVDGLDLSGLLIRPVVEKVSAWTLGRSPQWKLESEGAQEALNEWWTEEHSKVLGAWDDALNEGDAFILVHTDSTLGILPPESVEVIVAEDNFSEIVGYRSTQVLPHPQENKKMWIEDEWRQDGFQRTTKVDGVITDFKVWENPVPGLIPIVHISNRPLSNQTFGHPECEALVPLLHKYGEVLDASIEGNVLQGRPTPVLTFETVQDLEAFDEANAVTVTQQLPDGRTQTVKTYDLDLSQLMVASGAEFNYKAPGAFVGDTEKILGLLFYLLLEHTQLPEFIFGNAITSSKASAETQMPVFVEYIKKRRAEMNEWLIELSTIVAVYLSLVSPDLVTTEKPKIQWEQLDHEDGSLTLATIQWAYTEGLIDEKTALMLAPVEFEDIEQVLAAAKVENLQKFEAERDEFIISNLAGQTQDDEEDE